MYKIQEPNQRAGNTAIGSKRFERGAFFFYRELKSIKAEMQREFAS
jgi:hypothetical protein